MRTVPGVMLLASFAIVASAADYRVLSKIEVGGDGGWDYVTIDSDAHRLYQSHATHVVVIDLDSGKVAGDIPDTPGVHGIAVAPKLDRGFVSNGRGNNVTVFELKTLKTIGHIATGQNPDAIAYDPHSKKVFTFNGRSKDSTVIDAASSEVKGTIPLGGKPEFAVVDGKGKLWVNIEDTHELAEIDTAKAVVTKKYSLEGCEDPSGLAFDPARVRLFSVCANKVMVISDPKAGKVIATVPIGQGSDGAGYDAGRKLAFSSNGEGSITVVGESGGSYSVVQTVQTQRGSKTMGVDSKTHKLYLGGAQYGPAPAATADQPRPRAPMMPGSFVMLVVGQE